MSKIIYGTHEYYARTRYTGCCVEDMKQATCCICYNTDNYYSCSVCRFCKEGTICCDCFQEYEDISADNDEISTCPICRNLYIPTMVKNIILGGLYKHSVIPTPMSNNLYRRWVYNYLVSDDYLRFREFNIEAWMVHRKYQVKVNKDIKKYKVKTVSK